MSIKPALSGETSKRWVWLIVPERKHFDVSFMLGVDYPCYVPSPDVFIEPFQIHEAPKGIGREVRLATEQETGLWAMKALPKSSQH